MLQLLDDGRLTDSKGKTVDFKNTVIIMTSNIGSNLILDSMISDNLKSKEETKNAVMEIMRGNFRPEFLNRIDEIVFFDGLNQSQLEKIVDYSAKEFIVIADSSKLVDTLGAFPLPVEIIPDSVTPVMKALKDMGGVPEIRMGQLKDGPVITDNGNFILDVALKVLMMPLVLLSCVSIMKGIWSMQ